MNWITNLFAPRYTLSKAQNYVTQCLTQSEQTTASQDILPHLILNTKNALESLQQATLPNPNIPERAKHIVQGNREQLIKATQRFLERVQKPTTQEHYTLFDQHLLEYVQQSIKSTNILKQVFRTDIDNLGKSLSAIENHFNEQKKKHNQRLKLQKANELFTQLNHLSNQQRQHEAHKAQMMNTLTKLQEQYELLKREKETLITTPEYKAIKDTLLQAARERQLAAQAITDTFAPFTEAIKKFAHNKKDKKLQSYADNQILALTKDYDFSILTQKEHIIRAIKNQEITLSNPEFALQALSSIDKTRLSALIQTYATAKRKESETHQQVLREPVMTNYEKYATTLKDTQQKIDELKKELEKLVAPSTQTTLEELKACLADIGIKLT